MLRDEEREAIEWLKRLVKLNKRDNLDDTFAEILLNLIEKQSKEIEELKNMKKGYKLLSYSLDNYISKDKIKAKIEELEKELEDIKLKKINKDEISKTKFYFIESNFKCCSL